MRSRIPTWTSAVLLFALIVCGRHEAAEPKAKPNVVASSREWEELLDRRLATFGHRNWIVIADSAYPAQSRAGIETVATGASQLDVVEAVLSRIEASKHVRPKIMLDAELPHVAEADAPGIDAYRAALGKLSASRQSTSLPHEEIIAKLDEAGAKFNVLILKTDMALPYTSVFVELECGYWTDEREQRLRAALKSGPKR